MSRPPMKGPLEGTAELSYSEFLRRYFPSIFRWCERQAGSGDRSALVAQQIALDLYRAYRVERGIA